MSSLRLKSANSDAVLEFSEVEGECFRVTFTSVDHSATRLVQATTDRTGVATLFVDAAREWRGWSGSKSWQTLDGALRMQLGTDRLGHVLLKVRIRGELGGPNEWLFEANLTLEAGQLEIVARDAARIWSQRG